MKQKPIMHLSELFEQANFVLSMEQVKKLLVAVFSSRANILSVRPEPSNLPAFKAKIQIDGWTYQLIVSAVAQQAAASSFSSQPNLIKDNNLRKKFEQSTVRQLFRVNQSTSNNSSTVIGGVLFDGKNPVQLSITIYADGPDDDADEPYTVKRDKDGYEIGRYKLSTMAGKAKHGVKSAARKVWNDPARAVQKVGNKIGHTIDSINRLASNDTSR